MESMPGRWMALQHQAGRRVCLILDGNHATREPLVVVRNLAQYCRLYGETAVAELTTVGPVILLVDQPGEPALVELLQHPQTNWGWLGSLPDDDLEGVVRHWRERLLVGPAGSQALYRFHDNRTLARALAHLPIDHWPVFLGPLINVYYWHEGRWCEGENPAPGEYPVPVPAPWLSTPNPQAEAILHANVLRYLLIEHSEGLAALVEFQDPSIWLTQVLEQARAWQWLGPQQLEFLVVRRLEEATRASVIRWQPIEDEVPGDHFERVQQQWRGLREKHE
ncbi:DUF4123 domain-containing protein [Pseudomonas antarctica]|uniref:DUF4123 domain-containing protein n=1 Tax=Pseudomonas antarctica TaxID=219572 RepID=UPI00387AF74E